MGHETASFDIFNFDKDTPMPSSGLYCGYQLAGFEDLKPYKIGHIDGDHMRVFSKFANGSFT